LNQCFDNNININFKVERETFVCAICAFVERFWKMSEGAFYCCSGIGAATLSSLELSLASSLAVEIRAGMFCEVGLKGI
jgi:hypothetical protein